MALVSGIGGGHVNANYFDKRNSIASQHLGEKCGCINISLEKKPKKLTKARLLKERIRQFSIWFYENEDHKEVERVKRRIGRKKEKKMLANGDGSRFLRFLYGFDVILWIVGVVFTLCSTIKTFGKNTEFYKSKQLYRLLGPGLLLAAVLILFLATALKHRMYIKQKRIKRNFYIVQKDKKKCKSDTDIKDPDYDSGNEEDIEMTEFRKQKDLEPNSDMETVKVEKGRVLGDSPTERKLFGGRPGDDQYNEKSECNLSRKAWAKSKWMRMDTASGESFDSDDVLDLTHTYNTGKDHNEVMTEEYGTKETEAESPSEWVKTRGNRQIKRFNPLSRGCFTAQSSIRSQASEVSFASTTSESAPLVRR